VTKSCRNCKQELEFSNYYQFYDKWSGRKYYSSRCRPCHHLYKNNSPTTKRNRKAEKLQLRYGLKYEQWETIRKEQNYSCMICGITEEALNKKLDVDHCHVTGVVRGVLCNPCNVVLGHARDKIEVLEAAAKYLQQNAGGYKS